MVAAYIPPDNTMQVGAQYKSAIDGAIVAGARIAIAFLAQAQDTPNMTVKVLAGALMISGTLTEVAAQNTGTIAAPVGNPRIDRVVLNPATGAISVVTGTPAASPVAPAIPADRRALCRFQMSPSTTAIANSMIVDERVGADGTLADGSVGDAKLANMPANSVKVRAANTSGAPSNLALASGQLVGRGAAGNVAAISLSGASMVGDTLTIIPGGWTLGTPVATTSGTAVDAAGFPSTARMIVVSLDGVATNGTSNPIFQLGDSGGVEITGYLGAGALLSVSVTPANYTTGFGFPSGQSANLLHGSVTFTLIDPATNTWAACGTLALSTSPFTVTVAGSKSLSAALDRIRFTTVGGIDTFRAGKINFMWQ